MALTFLLTAAGIVLFVPIVGTRVTDWWWRVPLGAVTLVVLELYGVLV